MTRPDSLPTGARFGGESLFRSLAEAGFVDTVEVAVIPIVLGGGIPLIEEPAERIELTLTEHMVYVKIGTVRLTSEPANDFETLSGSV
ncbi:dihydrofolate reductase family protein [Candidatus Palauibacter sp.]|uniref:dihydrofolate reductase family protein n=1 Tax=Candidatus Palauibacter sp. TaxID=3101350 RepID=UPI003CC5A7C5